MNRTPHPIAFALLLAPIFLSACVTDGPVVVEPKHKAAPPVSPTSPIKLNVSPLTRITSDTLSGPTLLLHLEFRDASGQSIKAYGRLRIELYQPVAPAAAGTAANPPAAAIAQTWDTDLRDPIRNALSYDEMITRTYTVTLVGIPDWLLRWARHEGDQANAAAPTIVVQYLNADATSADKPLRVPYTLTR